MDKDLSIGDSDTITISIDDSIDLNSFNNMNSSLTLDPFYSGGIITSAFSSSPSVSSVMSTNGNSLEVSGDANFKGDLKINGTSLLDTLSKIEERLSILRPDPEKLEHFEALRKAYEHYKTLEALCQLPKKTEE